MSTHAAYFLAQDSKRSPTSNSRAPSTTPSTTSTSSTQKAWTTFLRAAKDHHNSVNAAYATYYGAGTSSTNPSAASSAVTSPRTSIEAPRVKSETGSKSKTWEKAKRHAREHHEGITKAYQAYYGGAGIRS